MNSRSLANAQKKFKSFLNAKDLKHTISANMTCRIYVKKMAAKWME